ncbi:Competence protein F DNA transformation protein comF [Proteiniborus sp. DW1]|uniref:ComF family protein n=1 Tax=Proteiniborus sp. DW1 TaxID=1889883 RepID=UPI00092E0759|nr:ComF family protein [Proteiniborus sp. DW1]SCG81899.1 Competence protein F DNA transformation protein comF [Proteiniborus sp. DW1]
MARNESLLKKLCNSALDLIFPEEGVCFYCERCHEEVREDHVCNDCKNKLFFINENKCSVCGKPTYQGDLSQRCNYCIKKDFYFKKVISPLEFTGLLRKAIYRYKYESKPYMYKSFGEFMLYAFEKENITNIDLIVPVPLHRSRKAERGYNQAELLAKYLSSKLGIPLNSRNLIRTKATKIQNKLSRHEREQNLKDAFIIRQSNVFKDKRILLVDDIFTTGATVNECSRILMECGVKEVYVITIATGRYN